jgi:hypothetical protein
VTGQDIEATDDGRLRSFDGTAPDRVISTVDPEARHGHKTAAHGFDGSNGHVAVDPDSEGIGALGGQPGHHRRRGGRAQAAWRPRPEPG